MRLSQLFTLPKYITNLEAKIRDTDNKLADAIGEARKVAATRSSDIEKELVLYKAKVEFLENYFKDIPSENTIEKEETPEVELNEEMRFPIVDGVKFKFEGEEGEGTSVNIS